MDPVPAFGGRPTTTPAVLLTTTTRWPVAARMASRLAQAGCDVSVLCPGPGHPALKVRGVRRTLPYSGYRPLRSLAAAIDAAKPDIIVPCDDPGVQHLHALHAHASNQGTDGRHLTALIEHSLGPPRSHRIVSARYDLLKVAEKEGLRVPPTSLVNTLEDLRSWFQEQAPPSVLKADGTSAGHGVKIVRTPREAEEAYRGLTRPPGVVEVVKQLILHRDRGWVLAHTIRRKPAVIVQSFIRGRPANCAVSCWAGSVLAGFSVEVVSTGRATDPAIVVRVVDNPAMLRAAERLAARLSLTGFFGLDFMIEEGSGEAFLIEMNPRCTPLCHLQLGPGRDMVEALRAKLAGQPCRATPSVTRNDLIAYFPFARHAKSELLESCFEDVPQGEPDLVEEILHPWSQRSVVGRLVDFSRRARSRERPAKVPVIPADTAMSESSGQP